ncbi:MAG: hypothetical protein JST68_18925 [Bacteroidetes bacterium]|nr:hypothetical protein [Bacteroidota bacterium]
MKKVFTLSLTAVLAFNFCFAASSAVPVVAGGASAHMSGVKTAAPVKVGDAAPVEISAPAPVVASPLVAAAESRVLKASDIVLPLGSTGKTVNLQELADMSTSDLEQMTGKKMGLLRRMEFKLAQRKLRHSINEDGTLRNKKLAMLAGKDMDGETGFHIGGFALGFFLGLIGVLIAYLINDENHSNRVKWSWIGCAVIVGLILIFSL